MQQKTEQTKKFTCIEKASVSKVLDDKRLETSSLPGPPAYKKEGGGRKAAAAMVIFNHNHWS